MMIIEKLKERLFMTIKYTQTGLWLEQKEDDTVRIGLSEKGQDDVGEVMFVDLPKFNEKINDGDNLIGVEGAKAVTEITSPVSGEVVKVHKELEDNVELLNSKDREDNWIIELKDVLGFLSAELSEDPWFEDNPTSEKFDE